MIESVMSCDTRAARQREHNGVEIPSAWTPDANNSTATAHNNRRNREGKHGYAAPTRDSTINPPTLKQTDTEFKPTTTNDSVATRSIYHFQKFELTSPTLSHPVFALLSSNNCI